MNPGVIGSASDRLQSRDTLIGVSLDSEVEALGDTRWRVHRSDGDEVGGSKREFGDVIEAKKLR